MRIGFTSNAPWCGTGYGVQTNELTQRLKFDGHDVAIMTNYGFAGSKLDFHGIPVFGQGMDTYSNDITPQQMKRWLQNDNGNVGLAMTLYDVWVYGSPEWDELPIASWVPIDHKGVPEGVLNWFKRIGKGKWAIAMSKFGERELLDAGLERERVFYAPHTINHAFTIRQNNFRTMFNIPQDAHLTIINAANKGITPVRKSWGEMLTAWSSFAKRHEDAYLFLWTEVQGISQGVRLERLADAVGAPKDRIMVVPQFDYRSGLPIEAVADAYNASDVLLMTSRGEGFGVPAIEAQACGTPVILTDWTAQTELCGAGWLVDGQAEWDEFQTGWWKIPNVDQIVEALEASYALKGDMQATSEMRQKAIAFANDYRTDKVYDEFWRPILRQLESELSK